MIMLSHPLVLLNDFIDISFTAVTTISQILTAVSDAVNGMSISGYKELQAPGLYTHLVLGLPFSRDLVDEGLQRRIERGIWSNGAPGRYLGVCGRFGIIPAFFFSLKTMGLLIKTDLSRELFHTTQKLTTISKRTEITPRFLAPIQSTKTKSTVSHETKATSPRPRPARNILHPLSNRYRPSPNTAINLGPWFTWRGIQHLT